MIWQKWVFLSVACENLDHFSLFLSALTLLFLFLFLFLIFHFFSFSFTGSSISVHPLKCQHFPGFFFFFFLLSFLIGIGWVYPVLGNVFLICICSLYLSSDLQSPLHDPVYSLGSADYSLWAKFSTLFLYMKSYWNMAIPTYLYIVYGCFPYIKTELSNCDRECMAYKTHIYYLGFQRKSLLIHALA